MFLKYFIRLNDNIIFNFILRNRSISIIKNRIRDKTYSLSAINILSLDQRRNGQNTPQAITTTKYLKLLRLNNKNRFTKYNIIFIEYIF